MLIPLNIEDISSSGFYQNIRLEYNAVTKNFKELLSYRELRHGSFIFFKKKCQILKWLRTL